METSGGADRPPAHVDPILWAIGRQIAAVRRAQGRIQEDVGPEAGMSQSRLSRIERGVYPLTVRQLVALAQALRVPVRALWAEVDI